MLSSDDVLEALTGIMHVILLLPVLLMLLSASAIWFVRNRPIRTQWGVAAAMAVVIWIISLLLRLGSDLNYQISVWQPSDMFSTPLSLALDAISWPIMYAVVTVLVAMIFTAASRDSESNTGVRVFWFLYSACAVLAILADNLLSVVITWTLFDFLSAIFLIVILGREANIPALFTRLSVDLFGVLLILAGAVVMGNGDTGNPNQTPLSLFLLAMGAFIRLGLLPIRYNLAVLHAENRGLGSLFRLIPSAIALTFIARLFRAGIPDQALGLFLIAGTVAALIGSFRWMLETDALVGQPNFILGISGVGMLAAARVPGAFVAIVAAAVLILLAGAVLSLTVIYTPSHRVFSLGAALLLFGIPWLPASHLMDNASIVALTSWPGLIWNLIIVVSLTMAILGCIHLYFAEQKAWRTSESLVRLTYGLGLSLPIFTSIGIGIQLRPNIELVTWILLMVQIAITVVGYLALRTLPEGIVGQLQLNISTIDLAYLYRPIRIALGYIAKALQALAGLIEGEAAILWIFAITIFLILASG